METPRALFLLTNAHGFRVKAEVETLFLEKFRITKNLQMLPISRQRATFVGTGVRCRPYVKARTHAKGMRLHFDTSRLWTTKNSFC